ncbi:MAG: 4-hydroxy-3-methylbut-2-enyl diphosphate reductase [Thermodesulfobacteriota bacterium]|nr:4-hydroxy-3-methylbut-2-enyl diphosphate reductase [Thermodesulfobacteriota bacterium]MEE2975723.1 4-hydroxy-3-methylbut-2-enyl diphosphate reductase [Thermodesulfobacteriota bacterium]|tara:strand:- start:72610 stop:73470 length:861 start_codon:yes stop_codon:yes gene_type:complete
MPKKLIIADSAGVCFGVEDAVSEAENILDKNKNEEVKSFGPLIHNPQMVEILNNKGLSVINKIEKNEKGTVIIRAHGIPNYEEENLNNSSLNVVDMTCPIVKRLQFAVKSLSEDDYFVLIVGNENHPEIIGAKSYAKDNCLVIKNKDELIINQLNCKKIGLVAQTTIPMETFWDVVSLLKPLKEFEVKVIDTLCDDIHNKQMESKEIAKDVDIMLVIGGKNSSNTREIAELCKQVNSLTYQIETFKEIKGLNLNLRDKIIGISAGASTPPWLIKQTIDEVLHERYN